jgi:hypothetical protein
MLGYSGNQIKYLEMTINKIEIVYGFIKKHGLE